ncbi:hypothetical protein [Albidovulum sp.]|uniref:hypothetical protein n=1 Tax=Albidovulum sp. TaxID=1872424 RepID=UPI003527A3B3
MLWGRWVAWPAASALLVFNGVFFWGFQNFLVTVPVAVFGFALWIAIEARPAWQRALAFVPVAAVVMLMHLYAFLGLALMAGGYEIQRVIEAPRGERGAQMRRCLILALPFVLMCGVELVDILTAPANPNGGKTSWGEVMMRFLLPVRMLASPFEIHWPRLWQSTVMVIVAFAAFLIATLNGLRPAARFGIRIDRRIAGPALALFVASLAVPYLLGGVYYSDMRFPIFFAMLLFAGSRWHGVGPGAGAVIATLIAAVVVMRSMAYDDLARHYDADLRDLGRIAGALPPGAKVLAVSDAVETSGDPMFWHLDAYLVPMAKVYVPSLFLGVHNFRVRSEWAEMSAPQTGLYYQKSLIAPGQTPSRFDETYVQDWDRKYDYVVMIGPGQEPLAAPDRLVPTAVSGRFSLYRVTP